MLNNYIIATFNNILLLYHFRFTFRRLRKHYLQAIGKMTWRCVYRGRGRSVVQHRRDIFSVICSLINVCSSSRSLLCLGERNAVLQGKIAFESCNSVFVGEKNIFYWGGGGGGGGRFASSGKCTMAPARS